MDNKENNQQDKLEILRSLFDEVTVQNLMNLKSTKSSETPKYQPSWGDKDLPTGNISTPKPQFHQMSQALQETETSDPNGAVILNECDNTEINRSSSKYASNPYVDKFKYRTRKGQIELSNATFASNTMYRDTYTVKPIDKVQPCHPPFVDLKCRDSFSDMTIYRKDYQNNYEKMLKTNKEQCHDCRHSLVIAERFKLPEPSKLLDNSKMLPFGEKVSLPQSAGEITGVNFRPWLSQHSDAVVTIDKSPKESFADWTSYKEQFANNSNNKEPKVGMIKPLDGNIRQKGDFKDLQTTYQSDFIAKQIRPPSVAVLQNQGAMCNTCVKPENWWSNVKTVPYLQFTNNAFHHT